MAFANSSRTQLAIAEETGGWGVVPSVAFNAVRFTDDDLVNEINKVQSEEVRSDQNISDVIKVSEMASGGFGFEFSYSPVQDLIFEGALTSDFASAVNLVSLPSLVYASADNSITDANNNLAVSLHQWIRLSGASTAGNNGFAQVVSISGNGNKMILGGITLTDETTSGATIYTGGTIKNSTTDKSYIVEKGFLDISEFFLFTGLKVNTLTIEMPAADKITGTVAFMGKQGESASATASTGAVVAAATTPITTSSVSIVEIFEDSAPSSMEIQTMSINIDRGLEPNQAIRNIYPIQINRGYCAVTGSITLYFEDATYFDKAKNNTSFSMTFAVQDQSGNAYLITLPNIKLVNFPATIPGVNQAITVPCEFQAILDPVSGCSIQIDKFAAA